MAKKNKAPATKPAPSKSKSKSTAVRNTVIPKVKKAAIAAVPTLEISYDLIARRAYEIYASGAGGTQDENWHRAERELRSGL